jgi:putative transposase
MPRKGHSEEKIVFALKQVEAGKKAGDVCREMGISQQTFYGWKRRYAGVGVSELRELRQLREENSKLKTLVADLTLDKHILQEVRQKKSEALPPTRTRARGAPGVWVK